MPSRWRGLQASDEAVDGGAVVNGTRAALTLAAAAS